MQAKYDSIIFPVNKQGMRIALDLYDEFSCKGKMPLLLTMDNEPVPDKRYSRRMFQSYRGLLQSDYCKIRQEIGDIFRSLGEKKVSGNLTLRELTMYKGVSLWDLSVQHVFAELLPALYNFNVIEAVLDFEKPSEIHIIGNSDNIAGVSKLISEKKQIRFFTHEIPVNSIGCISKFFRSFVIFAKKIKRFLVSFYFLIRNLIKSWKLNKKYKVIFFTPVKRAFDSILPVILKYNHKERLVINTFLSGCLKKMKENEIFYTDYLGYKPYNLFGRRILRKIRKTLNKNKCFYREVSYRGAPIRVMLDSIFDRFTGEIFSDIMQNVDIIRKIITSHKPEIIVVVHYSVDIVLTAKTLSIPTVAIQNGYIDELCYFGPVINDAVTVDSSYCKQHLLKKQNIDRIYVTGPAKFDVISNGKDLDAILNLDKSKSIVIFATTPGVVFPMGFVEYEKVEHFKNVCSAIKNIKEVYLIVKLHPNEKEAELYEKIIKETGLIEYSIVRDVEILELLRCCDLLIAYNSTVSYEAVLLDKNIISLHGMFNSELDDPWDFERYNAAIFVENFEKIESNIRNALFDSETITRLKKGREEYLREHAYKLDGNASGRVKEAIDSFLSK